MPPRSAPADLTWAQCCSPLTGEPLTADAAQQLATVLKAIAEPTRLRLLSLVAAHADGEACICDLAEPVALSQPTVSHHMKVLVDAGLLTREQRGKWAYYRPAPAHWTPSPASSPPAATDPPAHGRDPQPVGHAEGT